MDKNELMLALSIIALIVAFMAYNKKENFQTATPKSYCGPEFAPIDFPVNDKWVTYCTGQCQDQGNVMPELCPCLCAQGYSIIGSVSP
jgi:hypothetical protein